MNIPFPLETKVEHILHRSKRPDDWKPTGLSKELYVELSEPIVRQAVAWQDKDGRMPDPYQHDDLGGFSSFTAARFIGALGFLISAGRCMDLIGVCARSLDATCGDLYHAHTRDKPLCGAEFFPKELMRGYLALRDIYAPGAVKEWAKLLGGYDPERNYKETLLKMEPDELHNFVTFVLAGEVCKKKYGIADNSEFIERHIVTQKRWFTPFGMYRDPKDPMTYDYTSRMNLSLLLFWGYDGVHRPFLSEMLRRGALTSQLFVSSNSEAPFGGRSNQLQFNEATLAVIYEYEAGRYKALGDLRMAGAFKRAARLAALATKRWLKLSPIRFVKNGFPPETQHGRESGYGPYGNYLLLIASQFGFAHLIADDAIEEEPALFETGGFMLHLPDAFHKVFATCRGYHVEIDTNSDHHYDATGLGRIHRVSVPGELALSSPVAAHPHYLVSTPKAPRNVAVGPGWRDESGNEFWVSDLSGFVKPAQVTSIMEDPEAGIEFQVEYDCSMHGVERITEHYRIDDAGITINDCLRGDNKTVLVQIPLLKSDGMNIAELEILRNGFVVWYQLYNYRVECLVPASADVYLEPFTVPNRNGIYQIGCFRARGNSITYRLSMNQNLR